MKERGKFFLNLQRARKGATGGKEPTHSRGSNEYKEKERTRRGDFGVINEKRDRHGGSVLAEEIL